MINTNLKKLYQKLEKAHEMYSKAQTPDEKIALGNYMGNLYRALICMGDENIQFDKATSFGNLRKYKQFVKRINIYTDRYIENFLKNKKYHKNYFWEIIPEIEDELITVLPSFYDDSDSEFSKEEFLEVLSGFMKSINQYPLFQELYRSGSIHSSIIGGSENNLGFALHNPMDKKTDIFIKEFKYDIKSLNTLVHELGHAVDLDSFNKDSQEYNKFVYASDYGEVISRMFERLLFKYLLKNKIKVAATKDKYLEFEDENHDYLLQAYLLSILDDEAIIQDKYQEYSIKEIKEKTKKHFLEDAEIDEFIQEMQGNDLAEIYNYVYGDIISMFLTDHAEKSGLSNEVIEHFLAHRQDLFSEKFMNENGFTPSNYIKKYRREIDLIRK